MVTVGGARGRGQWCCCLWCYVWLCCWSWLCVAVLLVVVVCGCAVGRGCVGCGCCFGVGAALPVIVVSIHSFCFWSFVHTQVIDERWVVAASSVGTIFIFESLPGHWQYGYFLTCYLPNCYLVTCCLLTCHLPPATCSLVTCYLRACYLVTWYLVTWYLATAAPLYSAILQPGTSSLLRCNLLLRL